MIEIIAGRYFLFGILGIEALVLPFFLPKEVYGEVEFLKYTAFLAQFALMGSGTGYLVTSLKESNFSRSELTYGFVVGALLHASLVAALAMFFDNWIFAALSFTAIVAMVLETVVKAREKYLLAMSFKPVLSLVLILCLPVILLDSMLVEYFVLISFCIALLIYFVIINYVLDIKSDVGSGAPASFNVLILNYVQNIRSGFVLNISTAMIFLFFYIDRFTVKKEFPGFLGDYSLSFSIMQLTVVAITTFSYVNVVEFGKDQNEYEILKKKIFSSLKKCFILYVVIGFCSLIFAYIAESFYGYELVFETTLLMVSLFGLASVLASVNSAHLYLGSVNVMAGMMLVSLIVSVSLNFVVPLNSNDGYYLLLGKTYGLFLLFSVCSFCYICYRLRVVTRES
ncbi:MAG: hypothetical protein KUG64_11230 [Cycloclasticus sp.]|nr:hypothetical protein [Cycloclasticus sp.]